MGIFESWAANYYEAGLNVMPVIGKGQPTENGFQRWSKERISEFEFEMFCQKSPTANIGLLTGQCSGVIAFDFDYTGKGAKDLEKIILDLLPPTDAVKIGKKGFTRFYKYAGHASIKKGWQIDGKNANVFEVISNGRYTILPPSIHPETGTPYIWANGDPDLSAVPELSGTIIGAIIEACDIFFGVKKDTGRNNAIFAYALKCIHEHDSYESWKKAVTDYDKNKFKDNSWFNDSKENKNQDVNMFIEKMCKSWLKSIIKIKKQHEDIDFVFGGENTDELFFPKDIDRISKKYEAINDGFCFIEEKDGKEKTIPLYIQFAKYMYEVEGLRFYNKNYSFIHNGKYFEHVNELVLKKIISKRVFDGASVNFINNYFKRCEIDCQEQGPIPSPEAGLINLKNGVFDIKEMRLLPHSKKYFFTSMVGVDYDKTAKCDRWINFLNFIFEGDQERIDLIKKIFGYCLLGGYPFLHKAFVLVGDGRNGKSTLLNVLNLLLNDSASHVPMSELDKPFSAIQLVGKIANIVEETPDGEINSEIFKNIVGGGKIQVSHKNKDQYASVINARLIFACNEMPVFRDKKVSMLDRLVMIPFNLYIKEADRDTMIGEKLKSELPGIFNWAMDGASEVLINRILPNPKATIEMKEEFKMETDPFYAWFKTNILPDYKTDDFGTYACDAYLNYKNSVSNSGKFYLSEQKFYRRFRKIYSEKYPGLQCIFRKRDEFSEKRFAFYPIINIQK